MEPVPIRFFEAVYFVLNDKWTKKQETAKSSADIVNDIKKKLEHVIEYTIWQIVIAEMLKLEQDECC